MGDPRPGRPRACYSERTRRLARLTKADHDPAGVVAQFRLIPKPSAVPDGMQSCHRTRDFGQRRPAGDGTDLFPGLLIVGDAGEPPAQFDGGGKLAVLFKHCADRGGIGFGDDIHLLNMAAQVKAGKHGSDLFQRGQRCAHSR
jgi:hypothetical protein